MFIHKYYYDFYPVEYFIILGSNINSHICTLLIVFNHLFVILTIQFRNALKESQVLLLKSITIKSITIKSITIKNYYY